MEQVLGYLFPGDCYEKVVKDFNFLDVNCISFAFGRCLSLSILLGAIAVKLPQILKILASGSVEGLSYLSFLFELAAVAITSGYNFSKGFPFSTWGEAFFISIQLVIIVTLMFVMEGRMLPLAGFLTVSAGVGYTMYSQLIPMEMLQTLQGSTILLVIISKMLQVITTYRAGSTGQQAFITALMNWLGTSGRIFTTIKETMDMLILTSFCISFSLNTLVLTQFLWYWNVQTKETSIDAKKKA